MNISNLIAIIMYVLNVELLDTGTKNVKLYWRNLTNVTGVIGSDIFRKNVKT